MNYKTKLKDIKAFVFDYDGVMSDGGIYLANEEIIMRSGNVKDGYAIQHAIKQGFKIAILSGGSGKSIESRMKMLGVKDIFLAVSNKIEEFNVYIKQNNLKKENVLFMGDDIPDYDIMLNVGVATCPKDAAWEIKQVADYVSDKRGGYGCVRDVIEQVLKAHNLWFNENSKQW